VDLYLVANSLLDYNKLEEITKYVPVVDSHQNVEFCFHRIVAPRDSHSAKLAISKM
jgi:hypothetical protein